VLSRICSGTCIGLDAVLVEIEVDVVRNDKPSLVIVGLPDAAIREAKDRVQTAIKNSGCDISCLDCTVNLAPADIRKVGTLFDLPIALGILASAGTLTKTKLEDYLVVGELGLGGTIRSVSGILAITMLAKELKKRGIIVPRQNVQEAALVPDIEVVGVQNLEEVKTFFNSSANHLIHFGTSSFEKALVEVDFADVQGQVIAKRALEIAAAGAHNILLFGAPGAGKSLLAKALIGILPELAFEEALEVTKIYSCAGLSQQGQLLCKTRPYRSPHQTISHAGMVGGGRLPRPGEIVLAHRGVLFLDELPEFSRHTLEALRQPLEEKKVTISRATASLTFPSNFMFVAAMNPCPCGYFGHPDKACRDTRLEIEKYQQKISGPLLDRIDMQICISPVKSRELNFEKRSESSEAIQQRVEKARTKQRMRWGIKKTNSEASLQDIVKINMLQLPIKRLMDNAVDKLGLSMRSYLRVLRVALTIMDLANEKELLDEHVHEALSYRQNIHEGFEFARSRR
jgi:magnesium chelatase family protein